MTCMRTHKNTVLARRADALRLLASLGGFGARYTGVFRTVIIRYANCRSPCEHEGSLHPGIERAPHYHGREMPESAELFCAADVTVPSRRLARSFVSWDDDVVSNHSLHIHSALTLIAVPSGESTEPMPVG